VPRPPTPFNFTQKEKKWCAEKGRKQPPAENYGPGEGKNKKNHPLWGVPMSTWVLTVTKTPTSTAPNSPPGPGGGVVGDPAGALFVWHFKKPHTRPPPGKRTGTEKGDPFHSPDLERTHGGGAPAHLLKNVNWGKGGA